MVRKRRLWWWLFGAFALLALSPLLAFVSFGLWYGLDVMSGLRSLGADPSGTTIDAAQLQEHKPLAVEWLGDIDNLALTEISGLALSTRQPELLWAHNDSGNANDLFALGLDGEDLGSVRVAGLGIGDWEDLASFRLDGKSYLLIGDVGDNYRWRRQLRLYVIAEPRLVDGRLPPGGQVEVAWRIRYRYPDEARRDCEALAVDAAQGVVLLLSKRVVPAEVYTVPLRPPPGQQQPVTAERVALLESIPQPGARDREEDPDHYMWRSQPTALDISETLAAVVTYKDAYLFARWPGEPWSQVFSRPPERLALPSVSGREAAALSPDTRFLYVSAERDETLLSSIFRVRLQADAREDPEPVETQQDAGGAP